MVNLQNVERWGRFELALSGPTGGNPYVDQSLQGEFRCGEHVVKAPGFYDGDGIYRVRFMPDREGEWSYTISGSVPELSATGYFNCLPPTGGNRGPVGVSCAAQFAYADGTPYYPFGTTCYAWIHVDEALQTQTLETLAQSPFNKVRMCVFPKHYAFNSADPDHFPFAARQGGGFDLERFDPRFFAKLERRVADLEALGIEADLILFHPYDKGRWGFDALGAETDARYLRYVIARLAAFRNVWWALANEYDFVKGKSIQDWERLLEITAASDPYGRLRSIHNGTKMYDHASVKLFDHNHPAITHMSAQHWDVTLPPIWHTAYGKPIVVDECCYEGNLPQRWGNITGQEMTRRFWDVVARGGYCTHGETFVHEHDVIWWAKGGVLHGESPARIAFLRRILEEAPESARRIPEVNDVPTLGVEGVYYLQYFGIHRPAYRVLELPEGVYFKAEVIDTWAMTIRPVEGLLHGSVRVDLPGREYIALRLTRVRA
ncbi:DUF5605 domain-containing protein [Paenibacillus sp. IB182496]|uniref:DUF5605 domain-containing protein n=1 Tax=Paenibacillus sabuli TaxID=2772509 RepID=A0A927BW66_9BACL|nr:DUF5605 domain-containing protein [Paenibacillus sabuli]MBD2846473.1 DUF5605 domain-containing protein [Paenibacillus sabuli]